MKINFTYSPAFILYQLDGCLDGLTRARSIGYFGENRLFTQSWWINEINRRIGLVQNYRWIFSFWWYNNAVIIIRIIGSNRNYRNYKQNLGLRASLEAKGAMFCPILNYRLASNCSVESLNCSLEFSFPLALYYFLLDSPLFGVCRLSCFVLLLFFTDLQHCCYPRFGVYVVSYHPRGCWLSFSSNLACTSWPRLSSFLDSAYCGVCHRSPFSRISIKFSFCLQR